jgi:hypothetical protein
MPIPKWETDQSVDLSRFLCENLCALRASVVRCYSSLRPWRLGGSKLVFLFECFHTNPDTFPTAAARLWAQFGACQSAEFAFAAAQRQ